MPELRTRIEQRKRAIPHLTMKMNRRNIIQCCNNTHQGAPRTGKQTCAWTSDLGNVASHVICFIFRTAKIYALFEEYFLWNFKEKIPELSININIYLSIFNIGSVLHWLKLQYHSFTWTLTTLPESKSNPVCDVLERVTSWTMVRIPVMLDKLVQDH